MVERVAEEILGRVPFGYGMTRYEAEKYARSAIAAMREPTNAMINAGSPFDGHLTAEAVWEAMIDEALK